MYSDRATPLGRFPMRFLTAAVILTEIVFAWLSWGVYHSYRFTKVAEERSVTVEQLRGTIIYLDEILTMSAHGSCYRGSGVGRAIPQVRAATWLGDRGGNCLDASSSHR